MKCPWCACYDSKVTKTTHELLEGETVIVRLRKCMNAECAKTWKSFETYGDHNADRAFDTGEAASIIRRVFDWLKSPAVHIPIVRDAREQLNKALGLLDAKK